MLCPRFGFNDQAKKSSAHLIAYRRNVVQIGQRWHLMAPSQGSARASAVCSEKRGILFNPPSAKVRETSEHPVGSQLSCTTR